ncbi:replication-relaxation family protein [Alkalihalobacillus pseudalcaliphilus]|uniref:replication-relaxation family protein n=1 Tax=Alkalihalobacillus pseudalcaliphilus TaxID=79884 RepID=UPI00064DE77E|nr:replication-relaxation family protein [Alkalihalobacillus pseudalcaliphilus]KMK77635.1 hypothetical protein AB990_04040 [Alkalihalobacillus pseudalcaliphilus]
MKKRDKAILDDLIKFRVMRRDDICQLHFVGLKQAIKSCNAVLKRLRRDGHIKAITDQKQYLYLHQDTNVKNDSAKISHFLAIVDVYKKLCDVEKPQRFEVEPKLSNKGTVEPDIFCIWRKAPFYIEVQRNIYSKKVFDKKLSRYELFYESKEWHKADWQPKDKIMFPYVWVIGEGNYNVTGKPFRIFHTREAVLN